MTFFFVFTLKFQVFTFFLRIFAALLIESYAERLRNDFETIRVARHHRGTDYGLSESDIHPMAHGMALRTRESLVVLEFPRVPFLLFLPVFHTDLSSEHSEGMEFRVTIGLRTRCIAGGLRIVCTDQ